MMGKAKNKNLSVSSVANGKEDVDGRNGIKGNRKRKQEDTKKKEKVAVAPEDGLLPVSLLCGFLGAGKTTLMKHILETKHADDDFKCAVIVNDMAALNIDKNLIDQSALIQSDEVIAMENGCFCCTLQSDLVDQIISLTQQRKFNYMLIEASGVSEPSQIAPLFDLCDDEHDPDDPENADHEHDPDKPQLGEVARLDTCVTVVDSADFHNNLESMKVYEQGDTVGTIAELLMEQVECSNVVVLNKGDLVNEKQQQKIIEKIKLINSNTKIVKSIHSKIDVREILDTKLYKPTKDDDFSVNAMKSAALEREKEEANLLECCVTSMNDTGKKCCKSKNKNMLDSGLSKVQLSVVQGNDPLTRHEKRFGISSFIYTARRPFHPGRLSDLIVDQFFVEPDFMDEEDDVMEEESEEKQTSEGVPEEKKSKLSEEEKEKILQELQVKASERQKNRVKSMGDLLRSKGFIWIATSNSVMGGWQQAGNVIRIEAETLWMCEQTELWEGIEETAKLVFKDMRKPCGGDYKYKDRRQELVFIGQKLKHEYIQKILDQCLLNDEEMELGPEQWSEKWAELDKFQLDLEDEDEGEEEEGEGEEGEEEEGEGSEEVESNENVDSEDVSPAKRKKKN